ncbi:MAG: alginate lyase family protein [Caldisericum sp.]|uniref:alginate lyase family protein n=1 Tax=Caldisericum sp. TaxID=2499687 RepID=UPI003D12A03E
MKIIKTMIKIFLLLLYKLFLYSGCYWLLKGRFISSESGKEKFELSNLNILNGVDDLKEFRFQIPIDLAKKTIEEANRICEHKFDVFDKIFSFGDDIQWKISENPNYTWPDKKWFLINLNNKKAGDVKYTWELNRFKHLVVLGRAYSFSKQEKYLLEFKKEILDWISQNPPEIGINWSSSLEVSLRAISWIFAYEFFKAEIYKDETFLENFTSTLFKFGQHIYENIYYSEFFLRNNHLIGEVVGLVLISYFLGSDACKIWREKAFQILQEEVINQIRDDGSSIENSSSYSIFSMYLLLLLIVVLKRKGDNLDNLLLRKVQKGLEVAKAMRKIDNTNVNFGDSDDAKVLLLSNLPQLEDLLNIASIVFERDDFKINTSDDFQESIFWIFGKQGLARWKTMKLVSGEREVVFCPEGGIGLYNNQRGDLIFVQLTGASGHGHSGIGHFELSVKGHDVIVDSGTYKYNCSKEDRNYFRSTFAHNLLIVDSIPQDIPLRKFQWLSNTKVRNRWYGDVPILFGVEYIFPRFGFPKIFHRREFFLYPDDDFLVVLDTLKGSKTHLIEETFRFSPLVKNMEFDNSTLLKGKIKDLQFNLIVGYTDLSKSLEPSFIKGTMMQSWFSPKYGVKMLTPTVVFRQKLNFPVLIISLLNWSGKDTLNLYNNIFSNTISIYRRE